MKALRILPMALLLASCSLSPPGRHELLIILPPLPPCWSWLPEQRMALAWRDSRGRLRSEPAMPGSRLSVDVERGYPQAILALPSSAGRGLRPAGALYPESVAAGSADGPSVDELALDWSGGYAGSLALALAGAGIDPWGFDLSRLASEAVDRCGDPWLVPVLDTARRLSRSEFRIDAFAPTRRSEVKLPGQGPWAPESPFASVGSDSVAKLPAGLWRFLGLDEELLASVGAAGEASFVRRGNLTRPGAR
jgi:hypothetical protein